MLLLEATSEWNAIGRVFYISLQPRDLIVHLHCCQVCGSHMEHSSNLWRKESFKKEGLGDSFMPLSCLRTLEITGTSSSESAQGRHKVKNMLYILIQLILYCDTEGVKHREWANWIIHLINYLKIQQHRKALNIQESNKKQTSTDAASVRTRFEWELRAKMLLQIKWIKQMTNTRTFLFIVLLFIVFTHNGNRRVGISQTWHAQNISKLSLGRHTTQLLPPLFHTAIDKGGEGGARVRETQKFEG